MFLNFIKLSQWIFLASFVRLSVGKLYTSPSKLQKTTYDYVIVGAGNAGNVVAARLTEDPHISVLVLEAGISDQDVFAIEVPLLSATLGNTVYDWNSTTIPQVGLNGRAIAYPRGKVLGGSSSTNLMIYSHGSSDDWNRYAAITGDQGWNWNNIQKYIQKNEKFVPPADNHNITGEFDPTIHGYHGAVSVSLSGYSTPVDPRVMATTEELSQEFPFKKDASAGNVLGIAWMQSSIGNGTRSSSSTAYLQPAIHRPNLDVVINAQVTKLMKSGASNGISSFRSVQFAENNGALKYTVKAVHEIILSAGAVGTPLILQLSGIGDAADLQSAGIQSLVHNPSVGRNLSDHWSVSNIFTVANNNSLDDLIRSEPVVLQNALAQWNKNRTGPLVYPLANQVGWLRLPNNSSIFTTVPDPSAGPNSAHFEMLFGDFGLPEPSAGHFMTILTSVTSPTSRGSIKISSANPFDKPLINTNFLNTTFDIFAAVESVKAARRFSSAAAWKDYIISPFGEFADAHTDAEIEQVIRNTASSLYHPVATAAMSPKTANWGVVDPDLKVKGVDGVRIVDGSVLPFLPSAHTQGPIYLFAERGADLIKNDYY